MKKNANYAKITQKLRVLRKVEKITQKLRKNYAMFWAMQNYAKITQITQKLRKLCKCQKITQITHPPLC